MSAPQPPGSTFKIVTASAALQSGIATPSTTYPIRTFATLSGVQLRNAAGEACGGSLTEAFTVSCNSVFAPLGARLGARAAGRDGARVRVGRSPAIPAAKPSTISPPQLRDDLAVGAAAIGQDRDLATPLQMASVGATIATAAAACGRGSPRSTRSTPARSSPPRPRTKCGDDVGRRPLGHRHRGGDPRARRRRKDRHRRAAPELHQIPRTPTRGSLRSPRLCTRRLPSRSCSSGPASAAPLPPRSPETSYRQPLAEAKPSKADVGDEDLRHVADGLVPRSSAERRHLRAQLAKHSCASPPADRSSTTSAPGTRGRLAQSVLILRAQFRFRRVGCEWLDCRLGARRPKPEASGPSARRARSTSARRLPMPGADDRAGHDLCRGYRIAEVRRGNDGGCSTPPRTRPPLPC